jgi:coenzyme Q-binding protein COQ10
MPHFKFNKLVDYTPKQMFDLVMDIESYPEFLPWCLNAKIIEINNSEIIADLTIKFNILTQAYRSKISTLQNTDLCVINIESTQGIFEYLKSEWIFEMDHSSGEPKTKITYSVNFKFKSLLFQKLVNVFFENISKKVISKFEARAKQIYQ